MKRASLWVVAGPNGAGKSTLVERYLRGRLPLVNPDNLQREQGLTARRAGELAIAAQNNYLDARESFVFETTLSGRRELSVMARAKKDGYTINLVFVGVRSPKTSITRIETRVAAGQHHVPPEDVVRRFARSLAQLPEAMALSDRIYVVDNSQRSRRLVLSIERNRVKFVSRNLPAWLKRALPKELNLARGGPDISR
ncbi:zeta toxin family protein [Pandoraea cepalis]|uniref:Zeta toxin family protein n=1 Tax=Pandoraea cepalis TaxID=2508294 RepID=A0AAW7MH80_9BURK|nr:zeta toxin family protein [Pandoraea cepalis]MDN4572021.1 zeta toxin family protein [Pandoraea cepalis]MDN4576672.1 zeta toxin family protein [Pandoraea cepalis]